MNVLRELNASEKERFGACLEQAKDYFAQKATVKLYRVDGYFTYSDTSHKRGATCIEYVRLTEEQAAAVKANEELINDYRIEKGVVTTKIDFDDFVPLYNFSVCYIDDVTHKMVGPLPFTYPIFDDNDYIFLLALELSEPHGITYNRLTEIDPVWAEELNDYINGSFFKTEEGGYNPKPYNVFFDEIVDDAQRIRERGVQ